MTHRFQHIGTLFAGYTPLAIMFDIDSKIRDGPESSNSVARRMR
jgi:hypothetical protein